MLDSVSVPPVEKKCVVCKEKKMLTHFDFSQRSRDGRRQVCKECKELRQYQDRTCLCSCENCKDGKLLDATANMTKLVLTRWEEGLQIPSDFRQLAVDLASTLLDEEDS